LILDPAGILALARHSGTGDISRHEEAPLDAGRHALTA